MAPARGDADRGDAARSDDEGGHRVSCHLDRVLADRGMTLTELADRVGVTVVNLSILKNDRARAIRFSTLTALCEVLDCQPGDLFSVRPGREQPG
jgi:putative transcriptional regulator